MKGRPNRRNKSAFPQDSSFFLLNAWNGLIYEHLIIHRSIASARCSKKCFTQDFSLFFIFNGSLKGRCHVVEYTWNYLIASFLIFYLLVRGTSMILQQLRKKLSVLAKD